MPRATRFRVALEDRGGLYACFGQYLAGRADLLPSPHLLQLRKIRIRPAVPSFGALQSRFPDLKVVRSGVAGEVCTARHRGRQIVIEFFGPRRPGRAESEEWEAFRREIRNLDGTSEASVSSGVVLDQFAEWFRLENDIERKRSILANLEKLPPGGVCHFPRLIPELQSEEWLSYEATEGPVLASELKAESASATRNLQSFTEALLEQSLLFSLVDAEVLPENMVVRQDGKLGFACVPAWAPIPVEWSYELLQYMASTVAGNSARAIHMLSRISSTHDSYASEQHLLRELSGLQPELKINVITPDSVTALENYWRALAHTKLKPPLFLQLFHRQWTLIGQINSRVAPSEDMIAESLWPVMGRILRLRLQEASSIDRLEEWSRSVALLLVTTARQVTATLEQVRDNDIAFRLETQEYGATGSRRARRTVLVIRSGVALAFLMGALYAGIRGSGTVQMLAGAVAVLAAVALTFFVTRIE
jgi:predicted unusual protein kinase regulating ubiquinone biosynthesis (AarF/ABC1/UbiB family)